MLESLLDLRTHVDTPENVRLSFRLAGPGIRLKAYLLDLALRGAVLSALALILSVVFPFVSFSGLPMGAYLLGYFVLEWGYGCLFEGLWNGQTPGKKALHLRVMNTEGYPIGFHEALLRNLLRVADALPLLYGVGLIATLCNRRMQRIGDIVAGTMVVKEDRQRLREGLGLSRPVEPIPLNRFKNAYRPTERTLEVIDSLFRRAPQLGSARVEEIARLLAEPLAHRLVTADERRQARRHPSRFLLRMLVSFHLSGGGAEASRTKAFRAAS